MLEVLFHLYLHSFFFLYFQHAKFWKWGDDENNYDDGLKDIMRRFTNRAHLRLSLACEVMADSVFSGTWLLRHPYTNRVKENYENYITQETHHIRT